MDPNLVEALEGRYQVLQEYDQDCPWSKFSARSLSGQKVHLQVRPSWDRDPDRLRSFLDEQLKIYGPLRHPQLIPLLDCGGNWCYLWWVNPPLPGRSLRSYLRQGPAELELIKKWLQQLVLALDFLHQQSVMHPSLDLDAVFVEEQKLWLQIPLVQPVQEPLDASTGFLEALLPSCRFLSPEFAFRGQLLVTSNYFSLGSLLYELLAAKPAFAGKNSVEVFGSLAAGKSPDCSSLPSPFDERIPRLLEPDPEKRLCQPELLK